QNQGLDLSAVRSKNLPPEQAGGQGQAPAGTGSGAGGQDPNAVAVASLVFDVDEASFNDVVAISDRVPVVIDLRSEEHTSELQSRFDLVCRLLLEKKKATPHSSFVTPGHIDQPHRLVTGH